VAQTPEWIRRSRSGWRWDGSRRPPFADEPEEGQVSVWDYPRPPQIARDERPVTVRIGDLVVAAARHSLTVCETAHPPTFYLPPEAIRDGVLEPAAGESVCEWKGVARYWTATAGQVRLEGVGWSYPDPFREAEALRDHVAFYPGRIECFVDGHRVRPQPGGFYGGWITPDLAGPFKGGPGTSGW
jgi:uncharacterized protein (DUF427 family)